jgi:sulfate adenylyltransferase
MPIAPHGGTLINRQLEGEAKQKLAKKAGSLERKRLNARELSDLEMIATGALSPLEGFMTGADYRPVVDTMRLKNNLPWTIPITLSADKSEAQGLKEGSDIALVNAADEVLAVLHLEEKFSFDKEHEAQQVLRTTDDKHPGVQYLKSCGDVYLGGKISLLERPAHEAFHVYRRDPQETRQIFRDNGWKRIVAFQTRNPIHRAHEYIQKCALEIVDALLVHPLLGETKSDDIPGDVRMACYETLLGKYYPKNRSLLSIFPAAMRYAGPREAIFHAIARKNYGCTHFIVGRDHAGVGNYYGTYDAHYIFDEFNAEEIGITPLFFDHTFYCRTCEGMASSKTCPHDAQHHVFLSGTKVREMLTRGEVPPMEFTRPEVAEILISHMKESK